MKSSPIDYRAPDSPEHRRVSRRAKILGLVALLLVTVFFIAVSGVLGPVWSDSRFIDLNSGDMKTRTSWGPIHFDSAAYPTDFSTEWRLYRSDNPAPRWAQVSGVSWFPKTISDFTDGEAASICREVSQLIDVNKLGPDDRRAIITKYGALLQMGNIDQMQKQLDIDLKQLDEQNGLNPATKPGK